MSGQHSVETSQESDQLIALMSKYVFERQGIKLGCFDSFWIKFMEQHPEYKSQGKNKLRQIFICNVLPSPFEKNTHNLPEEEYIYLKFGDYDPDEEVDELPDSTTEIKEDDIGVVTGHNLHRNEFSRESLFVYAHSLMSEMYEVYGSDESSDSD